MKTDSVESQVIKATVNEIPYSSLLDILFYSGS